MGSTLIIDTDTHITEPPDLWTSRMSRTRWGNMIPEVQWVEEKQGEYWCIDGQPVFTVGTCIMVPDGNGKPIRSPRFPDYADRFSSMHPSAFDAQARLEVMDAYGIQAAAVFPNLGFVGPNIFAAAGPDALDFRIRTAPSRASTPPRRCRRTTTSSWTGVRWLPSGCSRWH